MFIELNNTVNLIGDLFKKAEETVKSDIDLAFPQACEEQITVVLQLELAKILNKANQQKEIERAFQKDIDRGIRESLLPTSTSNHIKALSNGIVAKVSWHKRNIEQKTGGDLGLLIVQPEVSFFNRKISLSRCKNERGLLVQAKLKKNNESWGHLTANQRKILKDRVNYLSLLRYEFIDQENRKLKDFYWTLCNGASIINVIEWLKKDDFPKNQTSKEIITNLGLGNIGTNDQQIINSVIIPTRNGQTIFIKIDWEDTDPGTAVFNLNKSLQTVVKQNANVKLLKI